MPASQPERATVAPSEFTLPCEMNWHCLWRLSGPLEIAYEHLSKPEIAGAVEHARRGTRSDQHVDDQVRAQTFNERRSLSMGIILQSS